MKIGIISDLHYDYNDHTFLNDLLKEYKNVDVICIAGDISTYNKSDKNFKEFCKFCQNNIKETILVLGNHDLWTTEEKLSYNEIFDIRKDTCKKHNINLLQNDFIDINGYRFLGSTYFTNFWNRGLHLEEAIYIQNGLNDFYFTYKGNKETIMYYDLINEHNKAIEFLKNDINVGSNKNIVLTHFAPSKKSIHKLHKNSGNLINSYFCNNDNKFIKLISEYTPLWIHGHTHNIFDYNIYQTRIICNPVGSDQEFINNNFQPKIIEI